MAAPLPPNTRPVNANGQTLTPSLAITPTPAQDPATIAPPRPQFVGPTTPKAPPSTRAGDLDYGAFTTPSLARSFAPQARAQQSAEDAAQREQERQQNEIQKANEAAARANAERAKRDANNAAEATFRQTNRPHYTDADGIIRPIQDDQTWAAEQQAKQENAQQQVAWKKAERPTWKNPVTNQIEPIDDEETWAAKQATAAAKRTEDLRRKVIDDEIAKAQIHGADPARATLNATARTKIEKALKDEQEAAKADLITRHSTTAKAVTGGNDFIPFNEAPAPEAQTAKARLEALNSNFDGDLSEEDLADLEADPTTAPRAAKLRALQTRLAQDDENTAFQQTNAEREFDLKLKRTDPAAWAARRQQRLDGLAPADHAKALEAEAGDFTARLQQHEQEAAPLIAQQQQHATQLADLETQAAAARQKGIPAGDLITLTGPDGPQDWPKSLAETYLRAQQQAETWQADNRDSLDLLQTRQNELQVEQEALVASEAQAQEKAKAQRAADLDRLTQSPITRPLGEGMAALEAEAEQRRAAITAKFPDPQSPQAQEALKALETDLQTKNAALQEDTTFRQTTAQQAYAGVKERMAADPENPNIGQHFVEARQNLVDLLGVTPKEADTILDDQMKGDWSLTNVPDRSLEKYLQDGGKLKEPVRILSSGDVVLNPELLANEQSSRAAIAAAPTSAAAKARALEILPTLRAKWAEAMLPAFTDKSTPFFLDFNEWREAKVEKGGAFNRLKPSEQLMQYLDEREADHPAAKLGRHIGTGLYAGFMDIATQGLSIAAMGANYIPTGLGPALSEELSSLATANQANSQAVSQTAAFDQAGLITRGLGQAARIAPSLVPSLAGGAVAQGALIAATRTAAGRSAVAGILAATSKAKDAKTAFTALQTTTGLVGAGAAGAAQTAGAQYADIYGELRGQGMTHKEAHAAAITPALLSGAATAILTVAFGATGAEKLLEAGAKQAVKNRFTNFLKEAGKGFFAEQPEEILDEMFSTVVSDLAKNPNKPVTQSITEFIETIPELAIAIGLMGGAGAGIAALRAPAAPKTSPEAAAQAPDPTKLPEVLAAARAAITGYQPAAGSLLTPQAATAALEVAQGNFAKLTTSQLESLGWTRENGKLKPLKGYAGPPALEFTDKEQTIPILRQELLDEIDAALPEVGDAIALDEAEARQLFQQQQQNAAAPAEAPAPGLATNVSGAAAPAEAPTAEPPPSPVPVSNDTFNPAEAERTEQITNHLTALGLDQDAAEKVAAHMVRVQGVMGEDYRFNVVADSFKAELKKLGITGALTRVGAQTNPLKAPPDLDARLSPVAPAGAVAPPANAPAVEAPAEPRGDSAQGAAAPAESGEDTPQETGPATPAVPVSAPSSRHSPNSRAGKLAAMLVADGSYTQQEADDALDDYMAARPRGTEKMTVIEEKKPLLKFLADRENRQNGGKLKRAQATATNPSSAEQGSPTEEGMEKAQARAVAAQPAGSRRRARRAMIAMNQALKKWGKAFDRIDISAAAKQRLDGGAMAVDTAADGATVLLVDLDEFATQHSWSATSRLLSADTLSEEIIHALAKNLAKNDKSFSDTALAKLWDDLTPKIRQTVWDSYNARALSDDPEFPRNPPAGAPVRDKAALTHEFLRMLVQKKAFTKRVTEEYGIDPRGILDRIAALLKKLSSALQEAIGESSKDLQTRLEAYQTKLLSAAEQLEGSPNSDKNAAQGSPNSTNSASKGAVTSEDNRAPVIIAGSPAPTAAGPKSLTTGAKGTAYTDTNDAIEYEWAVVETAELTISNRDDGTVDPAYPQELQPRDRTSAGSEAQVQDIAKNANLDRLSATNTVGDGAPIIGPDGVVESGNGRTMGIRRAYMRGLDSAARYKQRLQDTAGSYGLTSEAVAKMKAPMLVRVRTTNVDRVAFVMAANVSTIAPKREIEQAKTDAKQIVPELFESFVASEDGDIFTAANAEFIRGFIAGVVPPAERPAIYDAKGFLSQTGLRRIRNALFVFAYGDSKSTLNALARLTEDIEADGRNLVNALVALAPRFGEQNARIAAGALRPLSITADLAEALAAYQGIKERGETVENWTAQATLPGVDDGPTDIQKAIVATLHEHRRSGRKLMAVLNRYAAGIETLGDPKQASLFGEEPTPTQLELWDIASQAEPATPLATTQRLLQKGARMLPNGRPVPSNFNVGPLYHGTKNKAFTEFDKTYIQDTEELGFFFSDKKEVAANPDYTGPDGRVITAYAEANNPYSVTEREWGNGSGLSPEEAFATGHDSYIIKGQDGGNTWILPEPRSILFAAPKTASIAPNNALKLYRKLKQIEKERGALDATQAQTLRRAEASLGQTFFPFEAEAGAATADFSLETESTPSGGNQAAAPEEQLKLFMATKKSLYSKAGKEKHLRPIIRMMVKLRAGVQDALIRAVQETVIPKIPPRLRDIMDQASADYNAWLEPRMADLKPQWEAYKARFTPAIVDAYNDKLEAIAAELGVMPMTRVPLKGDRGMEKAILDAEDDSVNGVAPPPDVTTVNDVLRATLVADDDAGVARIVAALRSKFKVVYSKDRFTKPVGGYHDWLFTVEVAPGLNAEVQVHRIDYLFSKEIGPGHLMYEDWRRLNRLVKLNPAPELAQLYRRLSKAMEGYYTAIAQAFNISRNAASSISTPSLSNRAPSAIGRGAGDPRQVIGTGGLPSMSQVAGLPFTSKNFVVGGNVSGTFTTEDTTDSLENQAVRITTANISAYAGNVDTTALQGRQKDWKQAFDWQPGVPVVPLSKLISPKNELEDPKFKAGLKKDPRQNAADWILKALQGEPGAKKRAPLDVSANPDGTYTISDGNATAQALMLAGWKAVPVMVRPAPLAMARKTRDTGSADLFSFDFGGSQSTTTTTRPAPDLGFTSLLTPAQQEAKLSQADQLDLFGTAKVTTPPNSNDDRRTKTPSRRPDTSGTQRSEAGSVLGDLFDIVAGQRKAERDPGLAGKTEGDLFAPPGQQGVESGAGSGDGPRGGSRSPEGDLPDVGQLPNAGGGDRPGRGDGKGTTPGVDRPRKKSPPERTPAVKERPAKGSPGRNIAFTRDAELSPRGLRSKLKANLEALRIVKAVETEGRLATAEEKQALIKFSGWGALSQAFDDDKAIDVERGEIESLRASAEQNRRASEYRIASKDYYLGQAEIQEDDARKLENWKKQWNDAHQQIKAALSDQEYRAAKRSTINAHFTAPDYIGAMWDMAEWLGFKGGNVLEPGAGIGHFFGIMPENLADRSKLFGVELDAYTAKILAILYPEADIQNTGFQTADIADNSIDLGISNVPFANVPVVDKALEAMGGPVENLHDYFFGKALTKLKPGGVQIFITSAFTMDKGNPEIRKWLAERADLVAAFRLPNDAFKENAGTDVVTDIIVLRKKDGKPFPHAQDWSSLGDSVTRKGEPIRINQYFAAHPQNILGLLDNDGSMFAARDGETDKKEMTVHSDPNRPARVMLQQAIASLPRDIFGSDGTQSQARVGLSAVKAGNIVARDGKFYFQGTETPDKDLNDPKNASRVKAYIAVRDALNTQYDLELSEDATPEDIETNRFRLNATYDSFVSRFENFHNKKNKNLLLDDPDYFRLLGAEVESNRDKGAAAAILEMVKRAAGKRTYVKADIFKRRVLEPRFEPTQADSLEDAFGISLGWRGRVDIGFMASLLGETPDQVERALIGREIAVRDPSTGQILSREQYLAGNVRKKLEIAQASGPEYRRNVQLLETVQPQDIGIQDIRFKIGATWIPPQMYSDFLSSLGVQNVKLTYTTTKNGEGSDRWEINDKKVRWNGVAYKDFETRHIDVLAIMDSLLNFNKIAIYQKAKDGKRILLDEATAQAKETAKNLNAKFIEWARSNADTGTAMAQIYNKEANGHAQRTYDGQFLTFPWANKDFEIFPDKKNTIWRAIQEGFGLIAHGVGGGKTIIGSAIALEMRRLGMARKPMIVVHNSTLEGFAKELAQMAPAARVLVGRKDELQGEKRKEFLMRIAAGDWDAIVIAHSTFGMIADDPMVEIQTRQNVVDEMVESLKESGYDSVEAAKTDRQKSSTVKNLIKQIERMEAAIEKASKRTVDEGLLNFQQLGIDALIVDEIHEFKKMPFSTKQDAKGVDGTFSEKGYALIMRARQIQSKMGGKNIFTMTGTPVTNTLGEIWNMVRLVAPHLMKEYKIEHFDQFVSKFAEVETVSEMGPTGEFKLVDRLSKVVNLPEWATFLRMAADVKLGDALVVKNRPGIKGGKPELVAVPRSAGVSQWVSYIRDVLAEFATLTGKDLAANPRLTAVPVQAYMASRAAAIDIRLIEPRAKDEPDSKVNVMLDRLMGIYERTTPYNGTQVIFADSFNQQKISLFDSLMSSESIGIELDPTKGEGTTFNLYEDIRAKLIARGVPESEIAVITDSKWNDAKRKQALFEMVNEGKVRIIIGSTQRLGTGVNMQKRMAAGHHLDVPWTPAGLEQRDGRVFRQGNIHGEMGVDIELIRYGMKDTLDAALWQKLETKQRFITLSLSGKIVGRELEEVDEIMTLAEQRAVLSGPYGQEIFELETRLKELEAARNGHFNEADSRASEIASAKSYLGILTAQNARLEPSIAKMQRLGVTVQTDGVKIAIDGETFDTKAATNEALDALMQSKRDAFELSQDGQKSTASDIASITVNGIPVYLNSSTSFSYEFDQATQRQITIPKIKWHLLSSPSDANEDITFGTVGSAGTLFARLEELSESVDSLRSVMAANAARTKQLSEMAPTGAWPLQAEYDETLAKLKAVKDKLSGSPEAATAPAALLEPYYPSASTYYPAMPLAAARKTYAPGWPATFPNVRVHTTISALKAHPAYEKAKEGNTLAAIAVVEKFAKPDVLRSISAQYPNAIWVGVHAEEKRGRNKLPNALAQYAAALTGTEADSLIVQSTKTHRTGELSDYRLQNLPEFDGLVVRGAEYILVDDVVTMGGTFAELRAHIETHGGRVVHMTSLAASQFSAKIALDPKTRLALVDKFGDAALREFATNSLQIANWEGVTEGEARWILKQPTLERAGNRLTQGGQESINSRLSESLEEEIQQYLDLDNVAVPAIKQPAAKRAIRAAAAASTQPYPLPATTGNDRNRDRLGELRDRAQRAWRGLTGLNPEAIAEAFKQSDTISSLLHDFIRQDIPSFDIRGAIITSPEDFAAFNLAVRSPYFESLKIAVIGDGDQVIHSQIVHVGSLNESIADPKRIASIIASARVANPNQNIRGYLIAHNHPSGDPNPSNADRRITRRFEEVGALLGVPLLDHVVTNGTRYFSFKESGWLGLGTPAIPTELATSSFSSKPKLPILPTPDAPGAYNLADWEVVPASDPDALRPIANDPDRLNSLISNLATGDPGHLHAIYVDTQLRVRAVERIPETASVAKLIQTLIQGAAREGGYAVALGKSHSSTDPTPSDATRRIHRTVQQALNAADIEHIDTFITTPTGPYYSFAEQGMMEEPAAYSTSPLAAAPKVSENSQDENPLRLAQRPATASQITGGRLTVDQGQAVSAGWKERLQSGLRESGIDFGSRTLAQSLAAAFPGVPILTSQEEAAIRALPVNTDGAEAKVYIDRAGGVVYKRLADGNDEPSAGIWPILYTSEDGSGKLDWTFDEASRARHLGIRLGVMTAIGGTPTEIHGFSSEGHIYLKQPLSPNPNIGTDRASFDNDALAVARRRSGIVEIPANLLPRYSPRAYLVTVGGRPWFLTDLQPSNFIGDNQGEARVNDPVVGHITPDLLAQVPGLGAIVKQAIAEEQRLGDRSARLFAAPKTASLVEPGFYSQLAETIRSKMPARAGKDQITSIIKGGGKAEEVKWSGILPWVDAQTEPIEREAVLAYLAGEGVVRFEEVTLGEVEPLTPEEMQRRRWLSNNAETQQELAELAALESRFEGRNDTTVKFAKYQLPGGENYREVVLGIKDPRKEVFSAYDSKGYYRGTYKTREAAEERAGKTGKVEPIFAMGQKAPEQYTSQAHFPNVQDYVAHMRLNDRTDAEGNPGLFVEELQSDRHQKGRSDGYGETFAVVTPRPLMEGGGTKEVATFDTRDEADTYVSQNRSPLNKLQVVGKSGIPDAPFRKDWPLALFKRALRDAVATGKDWIGWTDGETQSERYSLSQQVESLEHSQLEGYPQGSKQIDVNFKDKPAARFAVSPAGNVISGWGNTSGLDGSTLSAIVGVNLAERVLNSPDGTISGDGLKVGGDGMKGFYDTILPKEIGRYVKQWGGTVVKDKIPQPKEPNRNKRIPTFSDGSQVETVEEAERLLSERGEWDLKPQDRSKDSTPIWRVSITPAMREGVQSGQPLFTAQRTQAADYDMVMARYQGQVNLETSKQGRTHSTIVRDLLQRRARGENISPEVLDRAVKEYFPSSRVKTPRSMSELPSQDQVERAITSDKLKNHRESMEKGFPTPGSRVTVRQDVPAWQKGVGVVTTVTNNGTFYLPATRLVEAVFKTNETKTLEIGMGENKGPHIAVIGKWSKDQSLPSDLDTWTQVGFNPDRHSFYYERGTERQVVSAKEIFQVGNTVFAKEPVFEDVRSAITYTAARTPNPLARLGWNHLDKSLSSKLAAHTRWMNEKTGAGETVAAWMQSEKVKPFTALGNVLKRELFPDSVLPREITARLREMNIKSSMGAQRAMDLTRALSGTPKFSDIVYPPGFAENPLHRRHLYEAMAGMRDMATLAPELQTLAKRLRSMLVEIGQEAVKQGRMSLDTFEGLRENYMPHFYEEDVAREKSFLKRFALGIKDIFAQRTTAWHIVDTQTKDKTGEPRLVSHDGNKWRFKNKEHRDAWFEDFIAKESLDRLQSRDKRWRSLTLADLNKRSALPAEARGRLQEIENGLRARYRKEKPLSLSEQEKAGLILDPVYSLARYAAQMVHDNATAEFFNFVASKPEWISDTPTPGFTQLPENTAFGRLSGKHVEDDIYRQLTELVETPNTALRLYDTVLSWWKTGKTVLNPGTHVRNVLGNIPFATFAGTNPLNPGNLGYYRDAIRHLRNGGSTLTEAYEDGVLGADFVSAELRQTLRQLLPDPSTIDESGRGESILLGMGKAIGQVIPSWAKNPTHKAYNQIAALYQAEDEVYKLASYLKARSMGMTREEAAAHTRKWFPYYDLATSATLKGLQRTGMPFLSFYRESIRIFGHAVTERPIALATTLALPSIVTFLSAMALGLDDDELEQIRKDMRGKAGKLLGPTPLGGLPIFSMLLPVRSANGDFQQFDISAIHPFADHLGNRVETDKTEDWWQQTWRSMLTAGPIGNLIYAQVTGRDAFGDRPFVEDNMTAGEKLAARIDNALKTALPPLTPFVGTGAATIANAGSRSTNKSLEVRDPVQAVLRAAVGLDVRNANPDIYRIAEDWRAANGIPTTEGMDFSATTPTSRARKALFTELARPEPKLAAIKNLTAYLEKQGSPVRTADDVRKLLFYRNPLMVIRGKENQQRFRASLTGQERTVLESAIQDFEAISRRAPSLILQSRAQ